MRPLARQPRSRTRAVVSAVVSAVAVVVSAVLILTGVLASAGTAAAADAQGGGDKGGDKGTVCADGRRDTNPADGVCTRDGGAKKDADKKDEGKKDEGKKDGEKKDAPPPNPDIVSGTPCTKAAEACADLGAKKAWLIKDGKVVRGPVPLASGGPGYETPRGDFRVQWKNKDHRSAEFDNAPMPWAVFFTDTGIAFHQGDLNSTSHGCIRLGAQDAEAFFNALNTGDDVQVR